MKILIGCEESQAVCIEFRELGYEAYSCDLLPCSGGHPEWHLQMDVLEAIKGGMLKMQSGKLIEIRRWDKAIFHPVCTFLTNAGVRHLHSHVISVNGKRAKIHGQERMKMMVEAANFFNKLKNCGIAQIAIENPIPHKYAREIIGKYDQLIQPWQFGHGETKATCLWLKGLPKLIPTDIVPGREARIHNMSPGPDRAKLRSKTFPGIAKAMAQQWSF